MDHLPFPKIPTALATDVHSRGTWVATEKIHGAQLVIATDGVDVAFGKRKAWLDPDGAPFFGWQMLRAELEAALLRAHHELGARQHSGSCHHSFTGGELHAYGELYGGHYPHPDVPALPGLSAVQTGIWYAPGLHYAVFDLRVVDVEAEVDRFLAHGDVGAICAAAGLDVVPLLARGSYQELAARPVRYPTNVPRALGLPDIDGNLAEGFVLKPDESAPVTERPVVKHKIPEFDDNRFAASAPFDNRVNLEVPDLLQWAVRMVGPERLASARSKVGEDPGAVREEATLDVWIDLEAIFPLRMQSLAPAEEAQLREGLDRLVHEASEAD